MKTKTKFSIFQRFSLKRTLLLLTLLLGTAFAWQATGAEGISDWAGPVNFTKLATPPDNDEACNATVIACGDEITQSMVGATASQDDDCPGTGTADVWFSFTSDGSQQYTIAENSSFDAVVQLFKGDDCNNLTEVESCSDIDESYTVNEAGTYYFRVRPYYVSVQGTITVDMTCEDYECPTPTDLAVDDITENSAELSWTTSANQSDIYLVEAGDPAPDENSTPTDAGVTSPINLDNLTLSTAYDAYVRSDCGAEGVSEWAGPETFTTLATPPDNDDCSGAIALSCGDSIAGTTVGATESDLGNPSCATGVPADVFYTLDVTAGTEYIVSVAGYAYNAVLAIYSGECDDLVEISCADNSIYSGVEETITYTPDTDGTIVIRTYDWSSTRGSFTISVSCGAGPECESPIDLAVDNITENSAELSWTTDATQSDIYLVEAGDPAPDENSTPTDIGVTSPITLDNLMENTAYDAYVRSDCGAEGVSDWAGPVSFTTLATVPDNDDCSGAIALLCGDSVEGTTVDATESDLGNPSCSTGTPADVFYTLDVTAGTEYTVSVQGADYDAVLAIYSGECDNLVEISCADNGFSPGDEETITYTPDSNGTIVIRTYDWSSSQGSFTISVSCGAGPECESPTNLAVNVMGPTTAQVTWSGNADDYEITWGISPYSPGDPGGSQVTTGNTNLYYIDTEADTEYDLYLRAICDDVNSEWTSTSFTSDEADECPMPTATSIDNITENSADITWTPADATDDYWEVSITTIGQSPEDGMRTEVIDDAFYTATGLDPDTDYNVYVRTICEPGYESEWFGGTPFTTDEADPEPCQDPYNDDAATSDVYISNIEIAGIGIDIGNPDYDFTYTSNTMSPNGYEVITNPTLTVYPGLVGEYTVSSGPTGNSNQYYYSVWLDFNQDGCFDADEQIIWSNDVIWGGGIPNGETGVVDVPMTWEAMAPGTYQARIRNSMMDHPMAEGNGDGEAIDFTIEVISEADAHRLLGVESQVFTNFTY
ncbi:fibronectin type III domain-containing protein, partial [Aequorivita capsosiphonis]|uniref:fibronectin type III domain-containing protein n=1 Tax=Aequorivita capsosiphonis TaxID=487317 RepID=UPI00055699A6